jgi:RimJ/RimL family protein N-acetyltransferase
MSQATTLTTDRLILRPWTDDDLAPFAALNADPRVVEFLPKLMTREESDGLADRIRNHLDRVGFGLWAVEVKGVAPFIGFVGLWPTVIDVPFAPCMEAAWRLSADHWGKGYASEAAREALRYGFEGLGLSEIVAFTVPRNLRSRGVMEKIGMTHDEAGDFEHPSLPEGHPLRPHVLYRARNGAAR